MDRIETMLIQHECQQLLYRVTHLIDNEQWEELANCYTEDGVLFRPSDSETGIEGRSAILDSFKARPPRTSCHILANSIFDVNDVHHVIATSRVWLVAGESSDTFPVQSDSKLMIGSFTDTLVRQNERWLIKQRKGSIELKYSYD